ncbi:hypothetical protein EB796_002123 [Bugula neritina]|uniref:Metalloendopeptidase n=1 Tax=Bugula neritina TaxID=10212 RepID=A0A7J7KN04_BUGNE|nr:hypothetical protein EB796_002123 [Bugula neritina]
MRGQLFIILLLLCVLEWHRGQANPTATMSSSTPSWGTQSTMTTPLWNQLLKIISAQGLSTPAPTFSETEDPMPPGWLVKLVLRVIQEENLYAEKSLPEADMSNPDVTLAEVFRLLRKNLEEVESTNTESTHTTPIWRELLESSSISSSVVPDLNERQIPKFPVKKSLRRLKREESDSSASSSTVSSTGSTSTELPTDSVNTGTFDETETATTTPNQEETTPSDNPLQSLTSDNMLAWLQNALYARLHGTSNPVTGRFCLTMNCARRFLSTSFACLLISGLVQHITLAASISANSDDDSISVELPPSLHNVYVNGELPTPASSDVPPALAPRQEDSIGGITPDEEDDILSRPFELTPEEAARGDLGSRRKRKVEGDKWPNGVVPFEFSRTRPFSDTYKRTVREAMQWWMAATCIRFVEKSSDPIVLSISNIPGCSSYVGYQPNIKNSGGKQLLKLGQGTCFTATGTVAHELGHALGLIHEQSRPDRDDHIRIHVDKINRASIHNFQTYYDAKIPQGVRYDLNSIMHYSPRSFALYLNKPTITAKNPKKDVLLGQRAALSYYDIMAVNKEYCQDNCVNNCLNEGYSIFKGGSCRCVCPEGLAGSRCERVDSRCGGEITLSPSEPKTITTPNYPENYDHEKCIWLINAPPGYLVQVTFDDLQVASLRNLCPHWVEIRNNLLAQRGDILCGNGVLGPFDTRLDHQNHQMMIVFDARNGSVATRKGFTATLKAFKDGCLSNPCSNGGTCLPSSPTAYTCLCQIGYTGSRCELADDAAVNCDFADDLCTFRNSADDQLDMRRMFVSTKYMESVQRDHNSNRFFIAAPAEFQTSLRDEARLVSPMFSSSKVRKRCLRFAYHMSGSYQARGVLAVSILNSRGSILDTVFERKGDQTPGWKNAQVGIDNSVTFQVVFIIRTSDLYPYNSLIAIDDISIEPHSCTGDPCANDPCSAYGGVCVVPHRGTFYCLCPKGWTGQTCSNYDVNGFTCDFEGDNCGWTNDDTGDYDWSDQYGVADGLRRTGPITGAGGAGSYMLADSSNSQAGVGRTAKLVSPTLNTSGKLCVEFFYHMYGPEVGELRVRTNSRGGESSPLLTLTGSQSANIDEWRVGRVTIQASGSTRVVIEAVSGERHQSDIAVDKIKISRGRCRSITNQTATLPTVASTPSTRSSSTQTSFRNVARRVPASLSARLSARPSASSTTSSPRGPITILRKIGQSGTVLAECDFEDGECPTDFINLPSEHNNQWIRINTETPSANTGPNSAYQGRYYIYTEASDRRENEANFLTTHLLYNSDNKACIRFHYSMYGDGVGTLAVGLKQEQGPLREVWEKNGNQGPEWKLAEIDVEMGDHFYQIVLRTVTGPNYKGDIAIDDIKILRNECQHQLPSTTQSPADIGEFIKLMHPLGFEPDTLGLQAGGLTITPQGLLGKLNTTKVFTLTSDISCNFEEGYLCPQFRQSASDDFDWSIGWGETPTAGTGPDEAASGNKYLFIEASSRQPLQNAKLETQIIPANSGEVCLKLMYHMKGLGVGTMNVYQRYSNNERRRLLTKSGEQSSQWRSFQSRLANDSTPYKIEFEAKLDNSNLRYAGDIALDDISITSGSC